MRRDGVERRRERGRAVCKALAALARPIKTETRTEKQKASHRRCAKGTSNKESPCRCRYEFFLSNRRPVGRYTFLVVQMSSALPTPVYCTASQTYSGMTLTFGITKTVHP